MMGLRTGPTRHLTFIGVADAALVAAIGAWLLDLKVILYTNERQEDRDVWYRNFPDDEEPHLTVIHSRQPGGSAVVQRSRTIQIPDATTLFRSHSELKPSHNNVVSGRVPWDNALYRTFGDHMTFLRSSRQKSFGTALGSAARIFSALNNGDPAVPMNWLRARNTYFPASYGMDFVHFSGDRFPELAVADLQREMMEAASAATYENACTAFEKALSDLSLECSCKSCCRIHGRSQESTMGQGHHSPQRCLVALTAAIIRLIRGLSGINLVDGLHPSRKGLEYIYRLQQIRVERARGSPKSKGSALVDVIVEHGIRDLIWTDASPLRFAEYVFLGTPFADEPEEPGISAISRDGLCFYLGILKNPLAEDPVALCWVTVVPGHIQFEGRLYGRVNEKATDLYNRGVLQKRPADCVPSKVFRSLDRCAGGNVMLNVTDSVTQDRRPALEVAFEILQSGRRQDVVGPWRVVHTIPRGLGLINCRDDGCEDSKVATGDLNKAIGHTPMQTITIGNSKVSLIEDSPISRLLVTANCWEPLIQREECLSCAVWSGCKQGWNAFAVLCKLPHPQQ
ncbi:uncharacterized protein APUU_61073S [Aspergillus puulaauensis]|uniref:Uncharacterized protein n=1 Tax=Aspergillus puulaauensis TaxID=1220207 RepID=A0A7R7XUM8_9EURO|nr:uncharacterized protein APUU_61073S [Aspergillus puulaauensis]BCS28025.1 hypothetical protein APUU_61073S [Aspergillus puulaauensis]